MSDQESLLSSGVQSLIDRLHGDGVESGKLEGQRIIAEAEKRAQWIIRQAEEEAAQLLEKGASDGAYLRDAGKDSLQLAYRDTLLALKDALTKQFTEHVQGLVSTELERPQLIRDILLEVVRSNLSQEAEVTLLLPDSLFGGDLGVKTRVEAESDPIDELVRNEMQVLLSRGVELQLGQQEGIQIKLRGGKVSLDLSDKALSEMLLHPMQQSFRAYLDGLIG